MSLHNSVCYNQMYFLLLNRFSRQTLCDPIDDSPLGSPVPGILQAKTLDVFMYKILVSP